MQERYCDAFAWSYLIFEFKDVVKSDEVRLNLQSHDSESLVSANMTALPHCGKKFTQGMTPDQTFSAYQNVLLQIQRPIADH